MSQPHPDAGRSGAERPHVVVADDLEPIREFVRAVLERDGYRVTTARDGQSALMACDRDEPQVVVTDLAMFPVTGRELILTLRRDHPLVVPVVLTGFGTVERTVDLMRVGAFDVLSKPCLADDLTACVARALSHQEALAANVRLRQRLEEQRRAASLGCAAAASILDLGLALPETIEATTDDSAVLSPVDALRQTLAALRTVLDVAHDLRQALRELESTGPGAPLACLPDVAAVPDAVSAVIDALTAVHARGEAVLLSTSASATAP